jgi:adenine-specific DNA methylase
MSPNLTKGRTAHSMIPERVECPYCGRIVALIGNGKLARHLLPEHKSTVCAGSGKEVRANA